ncbi:hypothetical protein SEF58_10695 [Neomoorella humiferrea]|uniref:hypothetical protein n=1 Tax=Neomoorella humiferrea TaxID=676965 RepID=UPI003D8B829D
MTRGKYTAEQIYTAVEAAHIAGSAKGAERLTGIPHNTLTRWVQKEEEGKLEEFVDRRAIDSQDDGMEVSSSEIELKALRSQKKAEYIAKAWDVALKLLARMEELIPEAKDVKSLAVTLGVLTDKLLLLQPGEQVQERSNGFNRDDLLEVAKYAATEAAMLVSKDELRKARRSKSSGI